MSAANGGRAAIEDISDDEPGEMGAEPAAHAVWADDAETADMPRLRILLRQADAREARRAAQRTAANAAAAAASAAAAAAAASLRALDAADASDEPLVARMRERVRLLERAEARQRLQREAEQARLEAEALAARCAAMQAEAAELQAAADDDSASDGGTLPMDADD